VAFDDVNDDHVQLDVNEDVRVPDHALAVRVAEDSDDHEQIIQINKIKIINKIKTHVPTDQYNFPLNKMHWDLVVHIKAPNLLICLPKSI
jgi:hypothetical protein